MGIGTCSLFNKWIIENDWNVECSNLKLKSSGNFIDA